MMRPWFEVEPGRVVTRPIYAYTHVRGFNAMVIQKGAMVGELRPSGQLVLLPGFRWDGASGPSLDTPQNLQPSAFHDAGYILIEQGMIPRGCRKAVDLSFYEQLRPATPVTLLDQLLHFPREVRALYHYLAVRLFGALWLKESASGDAHPYTRRSARSR